MSDLYVRFRRTPPEAESYPAPFLVEDGREASPGRGPFSKIMVEEAELVGIAHSGGEEVVGRYDAEVGWRRVVARSSEGAWDGFEIEALPFEE